MADKFSSANFQYRDTLFRDFFNEPTRLLSLCNALFNSNYSNPADVEINTLDTNFFSALKNDISCRFHGQFLILIEYQSTINNNMPFRCLSYVTELFNNLVDDKNRLYRKEIFRLPSPKFFVFYDGNTPEPLRRTMRLSDAFNDENPALELAITSFNINAGLNQPLLQKCRELNDYSTLIGKVKQGLAAGLSRRAAIIAAVNWCIKNGVMTDYLSAKRKEVFTMLDWQWNIDDAKIAWKEEGREEGREEGKNQRSEEIAIKMLRRGKSIEEIQDITELPLQYIQRLKSQSPDERTVVSE